MAVAVHAAGIHKHYRSAAGPLPVLRGLDLAVERGATAAITGESGSGKSTLLNIVAGLDHFGPGRLHVGGVDLAVLDETELARYRRTLGMVFQFHHLLRDFSVLDNLLIPALIRGQRRTAALRRARELLHAVGLSSRAAHLPDELSGANGSGWRWRAPWWVSRGWCWSTSRPATWTNAIPSWSPTFCSIWYGGRAPPWCW